MSRFLLFLLLITSLAFSYERAFANDSTKNQSYLESDAKESLISKWRGVLDLTSVELTLEFDISYDATNNNLSAKFACLEQNLHDFPVSDLILKDEIIDLKIDPLGISFEGVFNNEKREISGTFHQNGQSFPLKLNKVEKNDIATPFSFYRPQEPQHPYPYIEEEITYINPVDGVTLAATLTLPDSQTTSPAVILIAGSGPLDRNESCFGHKPFLVLSDHLAKQGIAVLRVDKRGVGSSTGNFDSSTSEDFASDVFTGIEYLKSRDEINQNQIGLLGHSEGGIIAPMVASSSKDVSFVILLAAPAVSLDEVLYEQGALLARAVGCPEEEIQKNQDLQKKLFHIVKQEPNHEIAEKKLELEIGLCVEDFPEEQKDQILGALKQQIKMCNSNWFRFYLTYDPAISLKKIRVPTLILQGNLDLQVSAKQNLPVINKIFSKSGNKDYQILNFPQLNHLFQTCSKGTLDEYTKSEETMNPIVLGTISSWILEKNSK